MLEDPESPPASPMLALAWGLLEQLPGQKLLTTNSGTCSPPCPSIRCAVWCAASRTSSAISWEGRYGSDDLRKIAFHVRINRPMSMFAAAGCWWKEDRDLAALGAGPDLRLQPAGGGCASSSSPSAARLLIKVARDFGIEWHLLTDGDEAGAGMRVPLAPCSRGSASGIS
jgi:putative ATP-dependent endonuclease of OLD family